ncbi:MAG: ComEC family competence protein [Chitinophagaceae bacterium]|nr:MAG: ComEC family competence protein [Chitinophagaceae bacterium]
MRAPYHVPIWKQAPIIRLLVPMMLGIVFGWYGQFSIQYIMLCLGCFTLAFLLINVLPSATLFRFKRYRGLLFHLLMISFGMLLTWGKDARHKPNWYGHFLTDSSSLLVRINEPLTVKPRSLKAEVVVTGVINGNLTKKSSGKLLLYFTKDRLPLNLQYGDVILINKKLQSITNSGNPGAFNYKRYAAFQLIHQQAFLKAGDWTTTNRVSINYFQYYLFKTRDHVLAVLKKYISDQHGELGIAEALLIGFKEDLDKDLVQAYSNTGVVHIIAISGLHLGLIYAVLLWIFNHTPYFKRSRHAKAISLVICLWLFALLTGGSASVLRSAVMFTVIVAGKYYFRQSSVYNSLATSAFILLCYNPYFLWDVGFQLSYCAVIGIVSLQQFIYRKWYVKNWAGRQLWSMVSVTLAAQAGAFPMCIYYFHQFPNLFLITNIITVPLSTIILFGEILLIIIGPVESIASLLGTALSSAIYLMNQVIVFFNEVPHAVWDNIYATVLSTWLLYAMIFFFTAWWMNRYKSYLTYGLICLALFTGVYVRAFIQLQQQKKIVIYNVSRCKAVDFIDQDKYFFTGDSILLQEGLEKSFHLKPARIAFQADEQVDSLPNLQQQNGYYQFYGKRLLFIDSSTVLQPRDTAIDIDLVLFSHNPSVDIREVLKAVKPGCIVFDASNSLWKIQKWKSACEELILPFHSVAEQGAFILPIE